MLMSAPCRNLSTSGEIFMSKTPLEAFTTFLTLMSDRNTWRSVTSQELFDLADAFLANPVQHREHAQLIMEAAILRRAGEEMRAPALVTKNLWETMFNMFRSELPATYTAKVQHLKEELLINAQPGEFAIDLLPTRLLETPPEWTEKLQLHLVEARVAIHPFHGHVPEKVSLALMLGNKEARLVDCFPSTEFTEVGEYEVGLTNEAKFIRSHGAGAALELGKNAQVPALSLGLQADVSRELSSSTRHGYRFKYPAKLLKIVSSAVAQRARWEILRTGDEVPTGGLAFFATALTPVEITSCPVEGVLQISLENWGLVQIPIQTSLVLSARRRSN